MVSCVVLAGRRRCVAPFLDPAACISHLQAGSLMHNIVRPCTEIIETFRMRHATDFPHACWHHDGSRLTDAAPLSQQPGEVRGDECDFRRRGLPSLTRCPNCCPDWLCTLDRPAYVNLLAERLQLSKGMKCHCPRHNMSAFLMQNSCTPAVWGRSCSLRSASARC